MVDSELRIYNLAVDAVGGTGTIETIDEPSREAELCSRWYGLVRDKVLRGAHWQSAKKFARLAPLAERTEDLWVVGNPTPAYSYAFSLPVDLIGPRHLTDFGRFDLSVYNENTRVLSTGSPAPVLCYTARIEPILMDISLANAVVFALAAAICEPLTGASRKAMNLLQQTNEAIISARVDNAMSENETTAHIPDFIAVRGYGTPFQGQNFIYPYGSLFTAGDIGG